MNTLSRLGWLSLLAASLTLSQPIAVAAPAESSTNRFVSKDQNTQREFPAVSSRAEWSRRAQNIRDRIQVSCGLWPMPEKTPLQPKIFGRVERDGYSVEKVYFQSWPGFYVAGNLYRPLGKGSGPFPAILSPHGHWPGGRLVDNTNCSSAARCIGFARLGMVAFSYDMVGYNDTHFAGPPSAPSRFPGHGQFGAAKTDLLWNISTMGLQTWDSIRALDFLESLPDVDRRRIACTGESGGGTQTFMLGAIDPRLAAQLPAVMVSHSMQGGCTCENAPGLRVEYSNMEIAAAAAPRPQMLLAATGDWTRTTLTVEGPAIEGVYRLYHAVDRFHYERFDFGHNYNRTSREAAYAWLGRRLLKNPPPEPLKEQPYQKEPDEALRVFPDDRLPADAVTQEQFTAWLKELHQRQWEAVAPRCRAGLKHFRQIFLPAWQQTLQLEWPAPAPVFAPVAVEDAGATGASAYQLRATASASASLVVYYRPAAAAEKTVIIVVRPEEITSSQPDTASAAAASLRSGLADKLNRLGKPVLSLAPIRRAGSPDQFSKFFCTYNRTLAQEQVRHLVGACVFARTQLGASRVVLCGSGRAGLWALLAAPAADTVVADCDGLNATSDEALLSPDLFCPGLRNLGTFEGVALLASPHPLLLHHTGTDFPTQAIQRAYGQKTASATLRVQTTPLSDDQIAEWIAGVRP